MRKLIFVLSIVLNLIFTTCFAENSATRCASGTNKILSCLQK